MTKDRSGGRTWVSIFILLSAAVCAGCGDTGDDAPDDCGPDSYFASEVIDVAFGTGQAFGQAAMPGIVFGPPRGGGEAAQSLDVVSLGNGGAITLGFGARRIVDGPGVDFVVFENAFVGPDGLFAELGTVSVSADGDSWVSFPCDAADVPAGACAGQEPVHLDGVAGPVDPETAGGDSYDLATVGLPEARFVRVVDREDLQGARGVFDLDAVGIVHGVCP